MRRRRIEETGEEVRKDESREKECGARGGGVRGSEFVFSDSLARDAPLSRSLPRRGYTNCVGVWGGRSARSVS